MVPTLRAGGATRLAAGDGKTPGGAVDLASQELQPRPPPPLPPHWGPTPHLQRLGLEGLYVLNRGGFFTLLSSVNEIRPSPPVGPRLQVSRDCFPVVSGGRPRVVKGGEGTGPYEFSNKERQAFAGAPAETSSTPSILPDPHPLPF